MARTIVGLIFLVVLLAGSVWIVGQIEAAAEEEARIAESESRQLAFANEIRNAASPTPTPTQTQSPTDDGRDEGAKRKLDPLSVSGVVRESGRPVAGEQVSVWVDGAPEPLTVTSTDANGRFEFEVPRPRMYYFVVGSKQESIAAYRREITADGALLELDLPLGVVAGTVRGPDGVGLRGQSVMLVRSDLLSGDRGPDGVRVTTTDSAGGYRFTRIPTNVYRLRVGGVGDAPPGITLATRVVDKLVVDGESREALVRDVHLERAGTIAVRVRDAFDAPVSGVRIRVVNADGWETRVWDALSATDSEGKLMFGGVAPGRARVIAEWPAKTTETTVQVEAGTTVSVDLKL